MQLTNTFALLLSTFTIVSHAYPQHESLAGYSHEEIERMSKHFTRTPGAQPPPGPLANDSMKLIHDADHQWMPLREGDQRGPCPGLNTLASHGYLDRSGIVTPQEIISAVQEAFNMHNSMASFVTYAAFIVTGNPLTNLMSIGGKSANTGPDLPQPAPVSGLNTHSVFEGDASTTRQDNFLGNNHDFDESLFQEMIKAANEVGNGTYNPASAALIRHRRIEDSIARNPQFDLTSPRFITAYAESVFPYAFFVDGRKNSTLLSLEDARSFFQHNRFPKDWNRRNGAFLTLSTLGEEIGKMTTAFPREPGSNQGKGNFVVDTADPGLTKGLCFTYKRQVRVLGTQYPDPKGALRTALKENLENFYHIIQEPDCEQQFPYGK